MSAVGAARVAQQVDQRQRPLALVEVAVDLLAVLALGADQVQQVVLDLERRAEVEPEPHHRPQVGGAARADQRPDAQRVHGRVPARLVHDQVEVVLGLERRRRRPGASRARSPGPRACAAPSRRTRTGRGRRGRRPGSSRGAAGPGWRARPARRRRSARARGRTRPRASAGRGGARCRRRCRRGRGTRCAAARSPRRPARCRRRCRRTRGSSRRTARAGSPSRAGSGTRARPGRASGAARRRGWRRASTRRTRRLTSSEYASTSWAPSAVSMRRSRPRAAARARAPRGPGSCRGRCRGASGSVARERHDDRAARSRREQRHLARLEAHLGAVEHRAVRVGELPAAQGQRADGGGRPVVQPDLGGHAVRPTSPDARQAHRRADAARVDGDGHRARIGRGCASPATVRRSSSVHASTSAA